MEPTTNNIQGQSTLWTQARCPGIFARISGCGLFMAKSNRCEREGRKPTGKHGKTPINTTAPGMPLVKARLVMPPLDRGWNARKNVLSSEPYHLRETEAHRVEVTLPDGGTETFHMLPEAMVSDSAAGWSIRMDGS